MPKVSLTYNKKKCFLGKFTTFASKFGDDGTEIREK